MIAELPWHNWVLSTSETCVNSVVRTRLRSTSPLRSYTRPQAGNGKRRCDGDVAPVWKLGEMGQQPWGTYSVRQAQLLRPTDPSAIGPSYLGLTGNGVRGQGRRFLAYAVLIPAITPLSRTSWVSK